jgi:glycosyltransferase involved in cell wall biosynthesis
MRIVFFTDHFFPEMSAPAAHIYDRCKIWVEQGHDVTVVTNVPNYPLGKPYEGYKNRLRSWEVINGIKVLRVGTYMAENKGTIKRTLDYISFAISSLFNSLMLKSPDVVYSTSPHIFAPVGAIIFSKLKRVPHVLEVRDLWPESIVATTGMTRSSILYRVFELLEKFIYNASTRIVVFTESFESNLVSRGIESEKLNVVINGSNINLFLNPTYDKNLAKSLNLDNKFVVGYMGTHGLAHNLLNAIVAASLLKDESIFFLFVGEGAEKSEMINLANKLEVKNIRFLGRQTREDIAKYWGLCDVGLVHLKNDPAFEAVIPSKIFETMAAGRPIMYCGPDSDGSRLIKGYDCGLVTNSDDPDALAKALISLKRDLALRQRLAMNGKKAAPKFSREVQAEATMHVLELASDLSKGEK